MICTDTEKLNCTHQSTENNSAHSSNSSNNCQSTSSFNVNGSQNLPSCLTQLDNTIVNMSSNCKYCQFLQSSTAISDNSNFTERASYSVEKEKCNCEFQRGLLVLGGDWVWFATILGLTGARGLQFCKDCLCKLSDLKKGQTPAPLTKYCNHTPANTQFETRTFEKLKSENEKYRNDGQPKQKVNDYNSFRVSYII